MRGPLLAAALCVGCSFDGATSRPDSSVADTAPLLDAPEAPCLQRWRSGTPPTFATPLRLAALATSDAEEDPWLTADERRIVFVRVASNGDGDIYTSTRDSTAEEFPAPRILSSLSGGDDEGKATFLPDLSRVFITADTGTDPDIWMGTATGGIEDGWTWGDQGIVAAINDVAEAELDPWISADGLALYWSNSFSTPQPTRIEMATRADLQSPFGAPSVVMASRDGVRDLATRDPDGTFRSLVRHACGEGRSVRRAAATARPELCQQRERSVAQPRRLPRLFLVRPRR